MAAIQGTGAGINLDEEKGLVVKGMNADYRTDYRTDILIKRLDLRVKKLAVTVEERLGKPEFSGAGLRFLT